MHDLALQLALIGVAGIAAQWLAWRVQVPAIILLLGVGLSIVVLGAMAAGGFEPLWDALPASHKTALPAFKADSIADRKPTAVSRGRRLPVTGA